MENVIHMFHDTDQIYYCPMNILERVFGAMTVGEKITQYLTNTELKNMATIKVMADAANFELNHRSKILHWRDGKITPPFASKNWERISQINFINDKYQVKLAIVISSDNEITQEKAENRALRAAETIRKYFDFTPICFVAQSDIRMNAERGKKGKNLYKDSSVLIYYGNDVNASALVVYSEDEETLKNRFKICKEDCSGSFGICIDDHQVMAFHFTMVNGSEPKNSEQIFSYVFPDIPISTLRLLGGPSTVGVNYPFGFDAGPVYVIIGWRKFGRGLSEGEIDVDFLYYDSSSSESSSETDYYFSDSEC